MASKIQKLGWIPARIKWYNGVKGYGFLLSDNVDDDIFVHATAFAQYTGQILPGVMVDAEVAIVDDKAKAVAVRAPREE
jgi:cold shock CspA family protein